MVYPKLFYPFLNLIPELMKTIHFSLSCIGERNGNPLQCSCLENPRDEGAWWAAIYGVAQSRTQLKCSGSLAADPPHAARLRTMARASSIASNFFIFVPPCFYVVSGVLPCLFYLNFHFRVNSTFPDMISKMEITWQFTQKRGCFLCELRMPRKLSKKFCKN